MNVGIIFFVNKHFQVLQDEYTNKARSNPAEFLGKQDFCFSETDGDLHINIQKQHNCNVTNSATSEVWVNSSLDFENIIGLK